MRRLINATRAADNAKALLVTLRFIADKVKNEGILVVCLAFVIRLCLKMYVIKCVLCVCVAMPQRRAAIVQLITGTVEEVFPNDGSADLFAGYLVRHCCFFLDCLALVVDNNN
jgi:hypothetical protein